MRPSRVGRKVDGNHAEIRSALESRGWLILSLAPLGEGAPDLLAWKQSKWIGIPVVPNGSAVFFEVKRPGPPSARKLTPLETKWHARWKSRGAQVFVVQSVAEALIAAGELPDEERIPF